MTAPEPRRRVRALVLLGAALVLAALAGLLAAGRTDSRASTDHGPSGAAALAGVLARMGYEVESLRLGLHVLSRKDTGVLFVISPPGLLAWPALTAGDATRVLSWVDRGGTLVLVQDRPGPLLDAVGADVDPLALPRHVEASGGRPALAVLPAAWTLGGPLTLRGRGALTVGGPWRPLFAVRESVVAAERSYGAGRVIAVADPATAGNSDLGRGGNLGFYASLVRSALSDGGTVYFDDLHAGGGDDHGVVAYARRAGGGPALLAVALLVLLALWRLGAREAPAVRPDPPPAILGGAEHVRALAGLYARADLGRHALQVVSRQFRRTVEGRAGIPWELDRLDHWLKTELGDEAARDFARVRSAFGRLFAVEDPETDAVLAAARLAARFERRWLGRRSERVRSAV